MEIGDRAKVIMQDDQFGGRIGTVISLPPNKDNICFLLKFRDGKVQWFAPCQIEKVN